MCLFSVCHEEMLEMSRRHKARLPQKDKRKSEKWLRFYTNEDVGIRPSDVFPTRV